MITHKDPTDDLLNMFDISIESKNDDKNVHNINGIIELLSNNDNEQINNNKNNNKVSVNKKIERNYIIKNKDDNKNN